jgi:hypothetical protein
MRKSVVRMLALVHELPAVGMPISANALGTISLEPLLSWWRRRSQVDYHFRDVKWRLQLGQRTTWVRTFPGLSPAWRGPNDGNMVL